jgi:hypothetical protein
MPNPYQARAVNRKKASATEKLPDPFLRPACETLRLNFDLELGRWDVRLNTYTDSVE